MFQMKNESKMMKHKHSLSRYTRQNKTVLRASYLGSQHDANRNPTAATARAPPAVDRYLLFAPRLRQAACRPMGQTDGRTDGHPTVTLIMQRIPRGQRITNKVYAAIVRYLFPSSAPNIEMNNIIKPNLSAHVRLFCAINAHC